MMMMVLVASYGEKNDDGGVDVEEDKEKVKNLKIECIKH